MKMESSSKEDDLLSSNSPEVELTNAGAESFLQCLMRIAKSTGKEETEKNLKLLGNVPSLSSSFDISKFNSLLLPNGAVKDWMMSAVQSGNQDGLILWSELVRILGKN